MSTILCFLVVDEDGNFDQVEDMYWFEENGIHEIIDGKAEGHFGTKFNIAIIERTLD